MFMRAYSFNKNKIKRSFILISFIYNIKIKKYVYFAKNPSSTIRLKQSIQRLFMHPLNTLLLLELNFYIVNEENQNETSLSSSNWKHNERNGLKSLKCRGFFAFFQGVMYLEEKELFLRICKLQWFGAQTSRGILQKPWIYP